MNIDSQEVDNDKKAQYIISRLPNELQEIVAKYVPLNPYTILDTYIGVKNDVLSQMFPSKTLLEYRIRRVKPYIRENYPQLLISCTCDSKEDSVCENLRWCISKSHVCMCLHMAGMYNYNNRMCRAKYHKCTCSIYWNVSNLHGGWCDTCCDCYALKHKCLCCAGDGTCKAHVKTNS